jgi:hypothetical protein
MSKPGKRKEMWSYPYFLAPPLPQTLTKHENIMDFLSDTQFIAATANVATLLFAVVIVLQILFAAGILPVSMAWGGRQTKLTASLRISSLIAAILLGMFIFVIRYRGGLVNNGPIPASIMVASWIITVFMAFNTLGNLASLSIKEKVVFGPVTALLTLACLLISASNLAI